MIDAKLIEEKPEFVKAALKKKGWDFDPAPLLKLFNERKIRANNRKIIGSVTM